MKKIIMYCFSYRDFMMHLPCNNSRQSKDLNKLAAFHKCHPNKYGEHKWVNSYCLRLTVYDLRFTVYGSFILCVVSCFRLQRSNGMLISPVTASTFSLGLTGKSFTTAGCNMFPNTIRISGEYFPHSGTKLLIIRPVRM